jgi:PAS domain S-box-containing protein
MSYSDLSLEPNTAPKQNSKPDMVMDDASDFSWVNGGDYKSLFDKMLNGFAVYRITTDEQGKPNDFIVLEVNKAFEKLTGLKREYILGKKITEVLPGIEKDPANWIARFGNVALSGDEARFDQYVELLKKWYSIYSFCPQRGYFAVVFNDITDHWRMESDLVLSENKYRTLVENLPQKVFLKNADSVYISCNQRYADDFEINAEDVQGKTDYDLYPKELADKYVADDKRIINQGRLESIDEKYRTKDGSSRIVETVKAPIRDGRGRVVGIIGVFWDITEKVNAQEELNKYRRELEVLVRSKSEQLKETEHRFQASVDTLLDGFAFFTSIRGESGQIIDFRCDYVNDAGCRLNRKTKEEQLGHTVVEIMPSCKQLGLFDEFIKVVETGDPYVKESLVFEDADTGVKLAFSLQSVKLDDGFAVSWRDVSSKYVAEERLKNKSQQMERMTNLMVGRELEMVRLKKENELLRKQINGLRKT